MIGPLVYGTVDAKKMWNNFDDELYTPILVGDKAVVMIWFNNFTDTDCGGAYLETWYNTFVTPKDAPVQIPYKTPFSLLEAAGSQFHQLYNKHLRFLQQVLDYEELDSF